MTTIAYRDGVLAADSRGCYGNQIVPGGVTKIHRLPDGTVAAGCGVAASALNYIRWMRAGYQGDPPQLEDATVIHLTEHGCLEHGSYGVLPVEGPFDTWGSGAMAALGALYAGRSAADAIEIAILCDNGSGGPVHAYRYERPAEEPEIAKAPSRPVAKARKKETANA